MKNFDSLLDFKLFDSYNCPYCGKHHKLPEGISSLRDLFSATLKCEKHNGSSFELRYENHEVMYRILSCRKPSTKQVITLQGTISEKTIFEFSYYAVEGYAIRLFIPFKEACQCENYKTCKESEVCMLGEKDPVTTSYHDRMQRPILFRPIFLRIDHEGQMDFPNEGSHRG